MYGGFNGTIFTAPFEGLYSFYVTARQQSNGSGNVFLCTQVGTNITDIAHGLHSEDRSCGSSVTVQATVHLLPRTRVFAKFLGYLYDLNEADTTYFEGRLISKIEYN